jgi:hypothetical protein
MPERAIADASGAIPAWSLLEPEGLRALLSTDGRLPRAIRVDATARPAEVATVPVVSTARLMIERAVANGGLKLTAGGALSRADTGALFDATAWPDFPQDEVRSVCKVINETDALPIHFTRLLLQLAGLLRRRKGLVATRLGKELLDPDRAPALFGRLFETAFWRLNLGYFDGVPAAYWPQTHIGIVLWSLSVTAHRWAQADALVRVCTIPDEALAGAHRSDPATMMELRVLRPLTRFGLMECRQPPGKAGFGFPIWFRKSALFDRVLAFEVETGRPSGPLQ